MTSGSSLRHPVNRRHRGASGSDDPRTLGERSADRMRNGMGSWPFVFVFLSLMGLWAAYNRGDGFDPYPFILLNLMLSTLAGLQGAILLIAAKRSDAISAALAEHDFQTDVRAEQLIEAQAAELAAIRDVAATQLEELAAVRQLLEGQATTLQLLHDHIA